MQPGCVAYESVLIGFCSLLQKLAFYSKMQEASESTSSASTSGSSASSSFSSHTAPTSIKEEECSPEKERPPEAEYINSRCVLFTYFQGDISTVVDEHFSRALSQPSSYSPSSVSAKAATRSSSSSWRGEPIGFLTVRTLPKLPVYMLGSGFMVVCFWARLVPKFEASVVSLLQQCVDAVHWEKNSKMPLTALIIAA